MTLHERAEQVVMDLSLAGGFKMRADIIESALREVVEECAGVAEHSRVGYWREHPLDRTTPLVRIELRKL